MIAVDSGGTGTYGYDADGLRVTRVGGEGPESYAYDLAGHAVSTIISNGNPQRKEVYAGSLHVATYNNDTTYFDARDWAGTERERSGVTGEAIETCTNLPYGDNQYCQGYGSSPLHFTGKMWDSETGLFYFGARYYNPTPGRWMLPDWSAVPAPVPYADLGNPQTLNLYAYVGNNPITHTDVDGHIDNSADQPGSPTMQNAASVGYNGTATPGGDAYASRVGQFEWASLTGGANPFAAANSWAQQQSNPTASVNGQSVTYTYPDGSKVTLSGTHAFRDNNPGDLRSGHGSIGRDGGFAIYPSLDAGVNALGATLTGKYADSTIGDTMKAFAPANDGNDPVKYAAALASAVGVPVSTKISSLSPAQLMTFQYNIAIKEGYNSAGNTATYTAPPQ